MTVYRRTILQSATCIALAMMIGLGVVSPVRATVVRFQTSSGNVDVRLYNALTPNSITNFMNYVTSNRYDGTFIHRVPQNPPPPKLFNTYGPGGYLIYLLGPETQVFIDGRLDVYKPETWKDYLDIESGRMSPAEMVSKYQINSAFLYIKGQNGAGDSLAMRLSKDSGWALCYFDDNYALFVRKAVETAGYIQKHEYQYVSPFDLNKLNTVTDASQALRIEQEVKKALETSDGSARAHVIAATHAQNTGDTASAEAEMGAARRKNPSIRTGTR